MSATADEFKAVRGVRAIRIAPGTTPDREQVENNARQVAARKRRGTRRISDEQEQQIIDLHFERGLSRTAVSKRTGVGEHAIQLAIAREHGRREERAKWMRSGGWRDAG